MRNLNGYEIGGRTLRVDNACTEKSRMEMQQLLQGPQVENPYGEHCDAEHAPEIITKTVIFAVKFSMGRLHHTVYDLYSIVINETLLYYNRLHHFHRSKCMS